MLINAFLIFLYVNYKNIKKYKKNKYKLTKKILEMSIEKSKNRQKKL